MKKMVGIILILLLAIALVSPVMAGKPSAAVKCKIEVKSKPVALIANHLFIVYTNATGSYFYRGGPSDDGVPDWGFIVTDSGRYVSGTVDYIRNAPTVTAATGTNACAGACFDDAAQRIETAGIPYQLFTQNSNSVTRTLLHTCGIPEVKPAVWAPGWETVLSIT